MKKIAISIVFFLLLSISCFAGQYKVLRVVDGDTIDILYEGQKERIRMLCVDTPESVHPDKSRNTPMGIKASDYTKKRLSDQSVDLEFEARKRGKFNRLLAYVLIDGHNFNVELVREGWSPYYTKYGKSEKHHEEFLAAEKEAKTKEKNIWSVQSEPGDTQVIEAGKYHGNVKSHKFHGPNCRHYNCKSCTKFFNNREDAIAEGYHPCGLCNP